MGAQGPEIFRKLVPFFIRSKATNYKNVPTSSSMKTYLAFRKNQHSAFIASGEQYKLSVTIFRCGHKAVFDLHLT
jgi:hypothetical protein